MIVYICDLNRFSEPITYDRLYEGEAMTSKPTARERFEAMQINPDHLYARDGIENHCGQCGYSGEFLSALVEAAVSEIKAWDANDAAEHGGPKSTDKEIWEMINQRMAEGEGKV